jgi:hypothetical protein
VGPALPLSSTSTFTTSSKHPKGQILVGANHFPWGKYPVIHILSRAQPPPDSFFEINQPTDEVLVFFCPASGVPPGLTAACAPEPRRWAQECKRLRKTGSSWARGWTPGSAPPASRRLHPLKSSQPTSSPRTSPR